jgi:hypothetical protein
MKEKHGTMADNPQDITTVAPPYKTTGTPTFMCPYHRPNQSSSLPVVTTRVASYLWLFRIQSLTLTLT